MSILLRILIFIAVVAAIFVPVNWIAIRFLRRIHPKRKRLVAFLGVAGNLIWPFLPFLNISTPFVRIPRSILGPVWFSWSCFVIVYCALLLLVALAWIPFRRRIAFTVFARTPSRLFLWLTILGSIVGFYQALVPLRVEHVRIAFAGLPPQLEGRRLVLLGDLHVGLFTRTSRLEKIFSLSRDLRPDAILLAGDSIDDDPYFIPKLIAPMRVVPRTTPIVAVLGNHEMYGGPHAVIERLRGSRVRLLVNEGIDVRGLWIAGVSDFAASQVALTLMPDLGRALEGMPPHDVPIVLAHQPRVFEEVIRRRLPLALVAHTHGGQLGIRPLHWSLAGVFLPYDMGLFRRDASQLYVNTGTGHWLVPFRLGMTPELTLIELTRG
jgi:predicted MPP superfamily phosphohydrolase